ncbi:MAG: ABC transporter substrate-binding protein [Candidatus Bathyarchaeia archaeon]
MKKSYTRKLFVTLLILTLAASILPATIPFSSAAEPQKIVFTRATTYNPPPVGHFNFFVSGMLPYGAISLEPLTHYYPANGSYVPGLAINWTYKDYEVFTLKLREGVKWHDGTEFTARDVWATWYSGVYLLKHTAWDYLKNITVVDDHTLVFYMKIKNPMDACPFYILWHWDIVPYSQYGALAEKVYAKILEGYDIRVDPKPFDPLLQELLDFRPATLIGTGPFKFKSVSETELVYEKFKDYWNGEPDIDEYVFKRVVATDVLWSMLSEGQLDWHWAIPTLEQHELMVDKPWCQIIGVPRPVGMNIYINQRVYPLNLKEVRQAIAYAINKTEIAYIQHPAGGTVQKYNVGFNNRELYAALNETFINKWLANFTYEYNPAKAEELLQGLGFTKGADGIYVTPNGTRLEFELKGTVGYGVTGALGPAMDAIAAQLERVGIKIIPRLMEMGPWGAVPDGDFPQGRYQLGTAPFGGVDFSFREIYYNYLYLYPGHGMPQLQRVPWLSEPVNVTYLTWYMGTYPATCTEWERNEIRAILSYITGDQVPVITMFCPTAYMYLNTERLGGWPAKDDILWLGMGSYADRGLSYIFRWNLLKPNFDLTISVTPAGGGATSPTAGTFRYVKGTTVTVIATPASGYTFKHWLLDGVPVSGATITFIMNASRTLEAVFEAMQSLTISVSPAGGGTTSPAPGTYLYAKGDTVTVTATPASWYNFKNWKLDGVEKSGATIVVTMDTSHTLEAIFERVPIELYAVAIIGIVVVIVVVYYVLRRR